LGGCVIATRNKFTTGLTQCQSISSDSGDSFLFAALCFTVPALVAADHCDEGVVQWLLKGKKKKPEGFLFFKERRW
jgi:hypothetical protein